ncbi:RagB/SusD family nutrient uptake outer membrane protein [Sphingobacterium sp.]|uniref:RagB/SusD family nutrient uptake outer membrane protein n=1 Tax=Sphingobacterium sp. TaxID=341027 RepID=UPI0031DAEA5F
MRKIFIFMTLGLMSCNKLDLNPLTGPSTGTFYANQSELELAVNDLYRSVFWENDNELFSDNEWHRAQLTNAVIGGTMNADNTSVQTYWLNCYKAIARACSFLENKDRAAGNTPAAVLTRLEAEMRLIRAYQYARLITHFGDVPFITKTLSLEEAGSITKTAQAKIADFIFSELDFAAANLPASYLSSDIKRLTKGVALAVKARTALYLGKYDVARNAAQEVIELAKAGTYALNPSFRELFLKSGETSKELILSIPRDQAQKVFNGSEYVKDFISRTAGGYGADIPTRDVVDAFECTDGLPIDESPRYNPLDPFKNRDPRLGATVVEFNSYWLGNNYNPHPDSLQIWSSKLGRKVTNSDSRAVAQFASYTGFLWKKGIDQTWADRLVEDQDVYIIRYAEMLLTYAEARIELNEIDGTVLDALNQVRARAYGVSVSQTTTYPVVTSMDQAELRKIVRRERRVEFVREGLRYMDLIRWKIAEKALSKPVIGLPDPTTQNRSKWPFPGVTPIDDDGIADYSIFGKDIKILNERKFDKTRQYVWPIPAIELRQNPNIKQNPNY